MSVLSIRDRVALEFRLGRMVRALSVNPTPEGKAALATLRDRLATDDEHRRQQSQHLLAVFAQIQL